MTARLSMIYTTFANEEDAFRISRQLLEKHLIACINILGEIKSLYFWKESLEENNEVAVFLKTTPEKVSEVTEALQKIHPYDTPAIIEFPIQKGNESFIKWVQDSVR